LVEYNCGTAGNVAWLMILSVVREQAGVEVSEGRQPQYL
jgi:hypothetical protein